MNWKDFYEGKLPPLSSGDADSMVLHKLREGLGDWLDLGAFMKWGLPIVKDLVALEFFEDCMKVCGDSEKAVFTIRGPLDKVDWHAIGVLLEEGLKDYKLHLMASAEVGQLQSYVDGLEYGLRGKLPGVENPGDIYRAIMKTSDAN